MSGEPHIRKVRPDDLEEVWRVHVASSNDLLVRRGRPAARPADEPVASDARAGLDSDPDGYFCAVEGERIHGMVSALVRGRVWYLSMFFVLPGDQGRGLGRALLERALAYGESRGAEVRCVWASLDPRAQARYVMAGMAPRWPIYRLEGDAAAVARLRALVGLDARERELPCEPGAAEKLTAEVFGHGRADDLAYWRSDASAAVAIERGGMLTAFAYRRGERIGPAAGRDETALLQAVAAGRKRGRRGKGDGASPRRLRFPARGAGRLRLPNRRARGLPRLAAVRPARALPALGAHPPIRSSGRASRADADEAELATC